MNRDEVVDAACTPRGYKAVNALNIGNCVSITAVHGFADFRGINYKSSLFSLAPSNPVHGTPVFVRFANPEISKKGNS